ncbi:unnamed protein product [Sympodiomycopsis kandeliae]
MQLSEHRGGCATSDAVNQTRNRSASPYETESQMNPPCCPESGLSTAHTLQQAVETWQMKGINEAIWRFKTSPSSSIQHDTQHPHLWAKVTSDSQIDSSNKPLDTIQPSFKLQSCNSTSSPSSSSLPSLAESKRLMRSVAKLNLHNATRSLSLYA